MAATSPRPSKGKKAPLFRLHTSITAVSSDRVSGVLGKPEVNSTRVLRPGTVPRLLAKLLRASIKVCAPNSAAALTKLGIPPKGDVPDDMLGESALSAEPRDATCTGAALTAHILSSATTCFKRPASAVKF